MNVVNALQRRQHGLSNELNYDFALRRLSVAKEDSWRGIAPSNDSSDYNPEPPIFSAKFANCDGYRHILAIANEDGKIALQDATKLNYEGDERSLSGPQCHHNAVFDLEWAPGQMKFVSASGDHTARLWEVTNSDIRQIKPFLGHNRSVKTAAFRRNDSSVFATGGRDGAILIWDTRANLNVDFTPRADNCIYSGHAGGPGTPVSQRKSTRTPKIANTTSSSITGLAFQDTNTLVSCGAGDGIIKVWDLRRNYTSYKREPLPKHSLPYAGTSTFKGFTNLLIDEAGARLFANCMDNTIYCYNLFSYEPKPLACYKGLLNSTFYIKSCLSPDGKYLLSGSSDEKAYIWNLDYPAEPLVALCGHNVEVTCVAWGAANDQPIVTCSDDARHKIWRIGPEELTDNERQEHYRGHAEFVRKFGSKNTRSTSHKYNLRDLDATPRSLKRLVEQNERTPGSMEKVSQKRSFLDMLGMNASHEEKDERETKRSKTMESKGRRLFSPCPNSTINNRSIPNSEKARCLNIQLSAIPEESPSTSSAACLTTSPLSRHQSTDSNNQENSNQPPAMPCSKSHTTMPLSELSVQHNQNQTIYNSPPASMQLPTASTTSTTSGSQQSQLAPISSAIYSPTSNLPNYVLDGEAPHLGIMSPKRKAKDKVDWLTKIRKQKLMSSCRGTTLTEKVHDEHEMMQAANVHSPRIQSLRNSEGSSRSSPRRRISHSGLHHQHHAHHDGSGTTPTPKTPTSSRRNSETTILRFFSVQRAQSAQPTAASSLSRTTQEDGGSHRTDSLASSTVITSTTSAYTQQQLLHTTAAAPSTATATCTE